jgi:uncharacterized protein (DUF4415 family)
VRDTIHDTKVEQPARSCGVKPSGLPPAFRPAFLAPAGRTRVTIRLDNRVLNWFRNQVDEAGGGNYQTLINEALREYVAKTREPLESTIRRVIREELRRAG